MDENTMVAPEPTGAKRVLVTGAKGMLGVDVCAALGAAGLVPVPADRASLDVTDADSVRTAFERLRPDAVIHCAAYTNVEGAETDADEAYRVNEQGSRLIAAACARHDVPLCAVSTDFVFDGRKREPYTEVDAPNPLGVYGTSKLAGEVAIREEWDKHWIVRTSWLFGLHGKCFPDSILRAAETRDELNVVSDQRGTPTYTADLAATLVRILGEAAYGTYHAANSGVTTWYHFARRTLELAGSPARVSPISSADWPSAVRRPANSALACGALTEQGIPLLRSWEDALVEYVQKRKGAGSGS